MQHKHKKRRYFAAAFLVAAVAIAGVGYALTYTGQVTNSDNEVNTKWIQLTLGDNQSDDYSEAFAASVYFDTYTDGSGTTWIPQYDTDTDNDDEDDAVLLGTVAINVIREGDNPYSITVTKIAGTMTGDFKLGVRAGSAAIVFIDYSDDVAILQNANADMVVTVSLYYVSSSVTSEPALPMDDVTFKFMATAEV